jgi:hypothetical protein
MRAMVSWEDAHGCTHRFQIDYDASDAEARLFLEAIELHVSFRLESVDVAADAT